ncbi:hypothetical protein JET76_00410 [Pseudomonas putida]|uniref:Uncharacterized protein n=1 Tax=Pseudomonas putida TaxID=303 RepID=A0A7W2KYJ6_PSEPU|nr:MULTISPECIES: hypothetical protein [Pseudomonas]MBA6115184.1 hypothetical protein [Pseudomonas putida]MBI6939793.1 hypothetical protein [Pseudomonas putida]MBI6956237.1 hypothetical protein [Pseudomonas putida]MCZ9639367.1 hypothetical protein [Pseudomonas putida]MEC4874689.1 hypothetical protein [Pseudomonas sp. NC26]
MTTGKSFTEIEPPVAKPGEDEDWPTGEDDSEEDQRPQAEDRDDHVDDTLSRESERGSGHPDPSRASEAERYSYQPWQKMRP